MRIPHQVGRFLRSPFSTVSSRDPSRQSRPPLSTGGDRSAATPPQAKSRGVETERPLQSHSPQQSDWESIEDGAIDLDCSGSQTGSDSGIWKRGAPITGLLQRRSIRTKLFFGVTTLAVTIVLLTVVGLVGFYRYRALADEISTRARELPMATDLSECATALRDCNMRICLMRSHEGMIDSIGASKSSMFADTHMRLEWANFDQAMFDLTMALDRYANAIQLKLPLQEQQSLEQAPRPEAADLAATLIDTYEQRTIVIDLAHKIRDINTMLEDPQSVIVNSQLRRNALSDVLTGLVKQTHDHLALMHGQMASFSDHIKTQHRVGIAGAWIALGIATLITVTMVWYFQMMVIGPFSNLVMGARLVARGEYRHRIEMGSDDEIGELGEILNEVTDRFHKSLLHIQTICREKDEEVKIRSREVIRNEQLAGIGFLAAGFAHEINNPMAAIAWSAESLESRVNDLVMVPESDRLVDEEMMETLQENLQRIQGEAYRCKSITERMLSFSRVGHVEREEVDISPLVHDVVEMIGTLGQYKCKQIHVDADEPVVAHANSQEIRQVILNLVTNAMESVDGEGRVDIALRNDGDFASVRVRDSGCGMTPEVIQHLFEPFYTRRRDGSGTGLGLSISYRIVSQHGGQLIPRSEGEGKGSEVELRLPIHAATNRDQPTSPVDATRHWEDAQPQAA
ncbi:sensor histidine kinase [Allorhodopirellula solitaria]|uniref:histidine kinase n=1 Tax=Allorhodopirellula solitaria TaxID=2527987 RepID=A0A5C5XRR0_9BACT|nr:HAMP domain-containing sensor histidine kinase [Allorhodopirellula solitaria]TWT65063.1 Sensor protein ZraS [Allorhodopirellula solitaria]